MDVSELRKQILRAIDDARRTAAERRVAVDDAARAYSSFLSEIAVPLLRQAATVLSASGPSFIVHTPAESVRIASETSPETYLEIALDTSRPQPEVIGRLSLSRGGRHGQLIEERSVVAGKSVGNLTEADLSAFLIAEIPKLVVRS